MPVPPESLPAPPPDPDRWIVALAWLLITMACAMWAV